MASYLRPRRGTASAASAIVLKKGEIFCEFKNNPAVTSGGTSCGAIKMGNGTTSYQSLGYFLNPDTDVVTWASTTADGQPSDWGTYGGKSATSASQGADLYSDLNALVTGSQNKKVLPLIKNLLFKLATQVTALNNDSRNEVVLSKYDRYLHGNESAMSTYLAEYNRSISVSNYTTLHTDEIFVSIDGTFYNIPEQTITISGSLGNNYYVYAKSNGTIVASTTKSADSSTQTLIGGFHYGRIRTGANAANVTTGIVPNSIWTLKFRPTAPNPDAMVYIGSGKWGDIYLTRSKTSASGTTGGAVYDSSAYGAVPATGTEGYCQFTFVENLGKVGKQLASYQDFVHAADGSPQGQDSSNTNAWSATTNTARNGCGYVAYAVSYLNICDLVGNVWKWNSDVFSFNGTTTVSWNWYTMNCDSKGQSYMSHSTGLRALISGGVWGDGSRCGSRAADLGACPWAVGTNGGAWAVSFGLGRP